MHLQSAAPIRGRSAFGPSNRTLFEFRQLDVWKFFLILVFYFDWRVFNEDPLLLIDLARLQFDKTDWKSTLDRFGEFVGGGRTFRIWFNIVNNVDQNKLSNHQNHFIWISTSDHSQYIDASYWKFARIAFTSFTSLFGNFCRVDYTSCFLKSKPFC